MKNVGAAVGGGVHDLAHHPPQRCQLQFPEVPTNGHGEAAVRRVSRAGSMQAARSALGVHPERASAQYDDE